MLYIHATNATLARTMQVFDPFYHKTPAYVANIVPGEREIPESDGLGAGEWEDEIEYARR